MSMDLRKIRQTYGNTAQADPKTLTPREYSFNLKYDSPEGPMAGVIVSRVLDADEKLERARLTANMAGCTWSQLPIGDQARIVAMSTVSIQLRDPPDWVSRWVPQDDSLLYQLFDECTKHTSAFFFGGRSEGDQSERKSRVSISAIVPAPHTTK